jgi:hypothetical protein
MLPAIHDILDLIHQSDAILGTGHLSRAETAALVQLATARGLRKIVVTHPEAYFLRLSAAEQLELAGEGVYFERCYVFTTPVTESPIQVAEIAAHIRQVGVESTVLSTDFGQPASPAPVDGMRAYLSGLLASGLSLHAIRRMAGENPADLLGL